MPPLTHIHAYADTARKATEFGCKCLKVSKIATLPIISQEPTVNAEKGAKTKSTCEARRCSMTGLLGASWQSLCGAGH